MHSINLIKILKEKGHLSDVGIRFIEGGSQEEFLSYRELYHLALNALSFLQEQGLKPFDKLVFQISDNKTFIIVFWACILGGIIPVPLVVGANDAHLNKVFNVCAVLHTSRLIISKSNLSKLGEFSRRNGLEGLFFIMKTDWINEAEVLLSGKAGNRFNAKEDNIAFIQFSSGSTGNPKGVVLTHKNLITNMQAISRSAAYTADDSMLSWMPLTHDMGLIGFHINPLFCGMNQFLIATNLFIRRPALWLEKATEHSVKILCSPNFGFNYLIKHCDINSRKYNWNLSSVRLIYNGAEPISAKLCHEFVDSLTPYRLKNMAMCPVYGLAEASLAVSMSELDEEIKFITVNRHKANFGDKILPVEHSEDTISFVNVGNAVDGCSIRIMSGNGQQVSDDIIGHIQIKGDNVTAGYCNNEEATKNVLSEDGWLRTGDLGFARNGSLYITGRAKDIIFKNGLNYYPHDLENIAGEVDGIELNKIVIGGSYSEGSREEEVIAFILHRGDVDSFVSVAKLVQAHINNKCGLVVDKLIPVKDIPRTTSGKLQRYSLLEKYKAGEFKEFEGQVAIRMAESNPEADIVIESGDSDEQRLLKMTAQILGSRALNLDTDFFEAGGSSLKAAEMSMKLFKEYGVELPIECFYEKRTIRELASQMAALNKKLYVPLPVAPKTRNYPLSRAQKRIYYAWAINSSSTAYNLPVSLKWKGDMDRGRLENCLTELIYRHDVLRTYFHKTEEPTFSILTYVTFSMYYQECCPQEVNEKLKDWIQPFDLAKAPLLRAGMLKTSDNDYIIFLDFHHIIFDGLSVSFFLNEWIDLYIGNKLPVLPIQYKDYVVWEKNEKWPEVKLQEDYWHGQLQGELPVLEMPLDYKRPPIFCDDGAKWEFFADKKTTERLRQLAVTQKCTLHGLLFAIYNILLTKYTGQEDLIIGIPVAGRRHPDLQEVQGMFVNNLPVRTIIKDNDTFLQLLERVHGTIVKALANQDCPFDVLIGWAIQKRDVSRNPLFDSMFLYQDMQLPSQNNSGFTLTRHFVDSGTSKFDISIEVFDEKDSLLMSIDYATSLFKKETIANLAHNFIHLINAIIDNPNGRLSELPLISRSEYKAFVLEYNNTCADYPKDKTIPQLFEEQVKRTPSNIAIETDQVQINYEQLNDRAEQLAGLLIKLGIGPGVIVGIFLERSLEMIISILAVLKSGGCYLPMETDSPGERVKLLIADSQCRWLISRDKWIKGSPLKNLSATTIINTDNLNIAITNFSGKENISTPRDLAYIIYTSGTSGMPKGVMIEHRSVVNYIWWSIQRYVEGEKVSFPLYTSISFDLTVTSVFTPLLTGNKIIVYKDEVKSMAIEKVVEDNKVDIIKLTPSHLKLLAAGKWQESAVGSKIKIIIVGGEKLETSLAKEIYDKFHGNIKIYNEYGPTEATVGCMIYTFRPDDTYSSVPVGVPSNNMQIYLLDRFLLPVPIGVKGEIYISGDGLARGYLLREDLTKSKFIPNLDKPEPKR